MDLKNIREKLRNMGRTQWITVILMGVLLLVIAIPVKTDTEPETEEEALESDSPGTSGGKEQKYLEEQLEDILEQMDGVGKVQVMITVKDSGEKVLAKDETYEKNTEVSENGNTSDDYTRESRTVYDGDDIPYETKELLPEVEGIVVVAQGAGDAAVETNIYRAVKALFDVDAHKISVVKMRSQEGT